jgi:DNA invertase Pin-like site-specific DNA recombinase
MCGLLPFSKFSTCPTSEHMLIGYARVSTEDQNLYLQRDALTAAGCERIFEDKASGVRDDRPGLAEALSRLRRGDCLVICGLIGSAGG